MDSETVSILLYCELTTVLYTFKGNKTTVMK